MRVMVLVKATADSEKGFTRSPEAMAMMEVYRVNAQADGINSTPSFMINGKPYSNMNFADFQTAIEAARRG